MTSIRKSSNPPQLSAALEADKKRRAEMAAKDKAKKDAKAALDAKKDAKKAQVDKKLGVKPATKKTGKVSGIFDRIKDKLGSKNPTKGGMMDKPIKQPVVKNPTKGVSDPVTKPTRTKGGPQSQGTGKTFTTPETAKGMKKGGMACKKYARGGSVSSRADGCAKKGKTKGKFI